MVVVFDPTPAEWIGLFACLSGAAISSISFVICAFSFHWKEWYIRSDVYRPKYMIPELYGFFRTIVVLMIGLAAFYVFRAANRADPATTEITNADLMAAFVLFVILLSLCGGFGWIFFWVGLTLSWMGVSCFWELASLAVAVVATYYFWVISLAGGILMVIVDAFFVASFAYSICYWKYLVLEGLLMAPMGLLMHSYDSDEISRRALIQRTSYVQQPIAKKNYTLYRDSDSGYVEPVIEMNTSYSSSSQAYQRSSTAQPQDRTISNIASSVMPDRSIIIPILNHKNV